LNEAGSSSAGRREGRGCALSLSEWNTLLSYNGKKLGNAS